MIYAHPNRKAQQSARRRAQEALEAVDSATDRATARRLARAARKRVEAVSALDAFLAAEEAAL